MVEEENKRKKIQKWGFGMAPLSETMRLRYERAARHLEQVLTEEISLSEVDLTSISELKGMFNRCLRKDQWDWFTVYERFGEPPMWQMRDFVSRLTHLRQCITNAEWKEAELVRSQLARTSLEGYLINFLNEDSEPKTGTPSGWVYILSTRRAPDLLKIGMTTRSVSERVREINAATGVVFPFSARAVFRVRNAREAERGIFEILREYRIRNDREFFEIDFGEAAELIRTHLAKAHLITRPTGTIKYYNRERGFGFLIHAKQDYFFHSTNLLLDEDELREGLRVEFDVVFRKKGRAATNITAAAYTE